MKKILYSMHVTWGWIKQRPHFLAEELVKDYDVDVLCKRMYNEKNLNAKTSVNIISPYRLPMERYGFIKKINEKLKQMYLQTLKSKYDIYWFTAPSEDSTNLIAHLDEKKMVVYDCMDDMLAFPLTEKELERVTFNERVLFKRANVVFCSSRYLRNKVIGRYGNKPNGIEVVNNALQMPQMTKNEMPIPPAIQDYLNDKRKKIVYLGTVSEWVDIELLDEIVRNAPDAKVYLWGPYKDHVKSRVKTDMIEFCGSIDHNYVYRIMEGADILIMPFILNELILSVNPVKLYEYILSGKPCVAPLYGESEPFGDYVYLYKDKNDCINLIGEIMAGRSGAKKTEPACYDFAKKNTWKERGVVVKEILSKNLMD